MPKDSVEDAKKGLRQWLDVFATRILSDDEQASWNGQPNGTANGTNGLHADWEASREKAMKAVNPRFVLRQWVLEEVIGDIEKAGEDDLSVARKVLARVLDVSRPSKSQCLEPRDVMLTLR